MNNHIVHSFAKLNLSLEVYAPKDGYHPLCSVFQTISLYDTLKIQTSSQFSGIRLSCNNPDIPTDHHNILVKIVEAYQDKIHLGLEIMLEKNIPVGGGLGGGSTNAAALLVWLNDTFQWGYSMEALAKMGATFGSDVPFFFTGGSACVQGIGDKITSVLPGRHTHFLLINPQIMVSSGRAYKALDERGGFPEPGPIPEWMLKNRVGYNSFKAWLWETYPEFQQLEEVAKSYGADELYLSGSGATTFLPFVHLEDALSYEAKLKQRYPHYWIKTVAAQPLGWFIKDSK